MMPFAAIEVAARRRDKDKLSEQVYQRLKGELHEFAFTPGQRLSEAALAEQMGVSRTPIREALTRLRDEGLVEVESKTGWFVCPIDFDRIDQLYDLRVLLELDAVVRLAQSESPETLLAPLRQVWLVPAGERLRDGHAVGELDERFHAALVQAAGNDEIARVHEDVTGRIRIVRRLDFTRDDRIDATYQEHARILRAVLQRKADQAKMLLRAHIEQSKVEVRGITLHALHRAQRRKSA
ncbi:MAG: GntR family transcriptional regulator [Betaproteobacteria bacterium]|nr:GntR family transcriptional regulator [Betaproteobacteria bacterium]